MIFVTMIYPEPPLWDFYQNFRFDEAEKTQVELIQEVDFQKLRVYNA